MIYKALAILFLCFITYWTLFGITFKGIVYWIKYYINLIRENIRAKRNAD